MVVPTRDTVFVGRGDIMRLFADTLSKAVEGHGSALIVSGEAGIGKTRATLELESVARRRGVRVVRGTCFPEDRSVPAAWISDLVRQLAWQPGDIDSILADTAPLFVAHIPELQRFMRGGRASDASELSAAQRVAYLFRRLLSLGPVLAIVEDLQWSDASGVEAVVACARLTPALPFILVGTYRADEVSDELETALVSLNRERRMLDVPIAGLTRTEAEQLVKTLASPATIDPILLGRLYALSEGNPYFLEEILRQLVRPGAARLELSDLDRVAVPRAIRVTVRRGMNQLSDRARRVVEAASVVGQRFSLPLLSAVLELAESETIAGLSEALTAGLVVEVSADQFAFRHALTREAVYEVVIGWERRRLHRLVAEALERHGADDVSARAALSDHWLRAEVWDRARDTAVVAAATALDLAAPAAATELFDQAEYAAQHVDGEIPLGLLTGRGRALELLGEFDRGRADLERAAELAARSNDPVLVSSTQFDLGWLWSARDYDRARDYFSAALDAARAAGARADIARALNRIGNWHLTSEQPLTALDHHHEALELFTQLGDTQGVAQSRDLIGTVELTLGALDQASESYQAAVEGFRAMGDKQGLASSLAMLTFCGQQYLTGPVAAGGRGLAERLACGRQALELTESINWRSGRALAMLGLANVLGFYGEYREALAYAHRGLALADELDHRYWRTLAHLILGVMDVDLLALERGARRLQTALSLAREIGSDYWARIAVGHLVPTLLVLGRVAEARELADVQALPTDRHGMTMGQRHVLMARAELALADGASDTGLEIVQLLEPPDGCSALVLSDLRARLLDALGRAEDARAVWSSALDLARDIDAKPRLWRLEAQLAKSMRSMGQRAHAAEHVGRAWSLLEELAGELPEEYVAGFLSAARAAVPPPTERQRRKGRSEGLTDREREVASHAARGMSNAEISRAMSVSSRTVEKHLEHAMGKLGLGSRVQLVDWLLRKYT